MKPETKLQLNDWITALGEKFWESEGLTKLGSQLAQEYSKFTCYPKPNQIFSALEKCQYKDLKFIIIGADPYSNGEGNGVCFSINKDILRVPPSLQKIYKAIEKECYNGLLVEFDYSLDYLTKQGGLLINSSLTVRKSIPGSHNYIWNDFMKIFLAVISCKKENLIVILIGKTAQELQQYISKEGNHKVYCLEHPSYAARQNRDWETKGILKETSSIINW